MIVGGAVPEEKETEHDRVLRHRLVQYLLLGVEIELAEEMARIGVDHHDLAALIKRGCSPDLAVAILV